MRSPSRLGVPGTGEDSTHNSMRDYAVDGSEITAVTYVSTLINGRGRWGGLTTPLTAFELELNIKYRLRVVNAASERAYIISVDEHSLTLLALDGSDIVKSDMDFVTIQPGERVDVELKTNLAGSNMVWFRAQTLRAGRGPTVIIDGVVQEEKAIIRFPGAPATGEPTSVSKSCTAADRCSVFNCPFNAYPANQYSDCISVASMQSAYNQAYLKDEFGLNSNEVVSESFFNWANVGPGTSVNGRKTIGAQGMPLYQQGMGARITPCDAVKCDSEGCVCTYFVSEAYDKTVQMVFTNYNPLSGDLEHHPIHVHGHRFAVLKIGNPSYDPVTGRYLLPNPDIKCNNDICTVPSWESGAAQGLNLQKPPLKDTINVPTGGYVVIRFRTMNPGLWFIHCHLASHAIEGMGFYFFEATDKIPPLPNDFPKCGDFSFSAAQYAQYQALPVPP